MEDHKIVEIVWSEINSLENWQLIFIGNILFIGLDAEDLKVIEIVWSEINSLGNWYLNFKNW